MPPPGLPSSIVPSQLLSTPSQRSALGCTSWWQVTAPPAQGVVPAAQAPRLPVLQATPPPGLPSSTTPSQSLSTPSQTSVVGRVVCTQWREPPVQAETPIEQAPWRPVLQAAPPPGLASSTWP